MEVKLGSSNLFAWQNDYDYSSKKYIAREIVPGIRVCASSNRRVLGVITDTAKKEKTYPDSERSNTLSYFIVEVYWQTGVHKGTKQWKSTRDLVNYDAYKAKIYKELKSLEDNEAIADKTGM